jgi:DNA-binding NarL/FixJ family response regulator
MPGMDGIEATHQITSRQPKARILMLTSFAADNKVLPASKAGAAGYLLKDSSPDELVRAIRQVHRGEPSLHPTIARKRLRAFFVKPIHQTSYINNVSRVTQQVALLLPKKPGVCADDRAAPFCYAKNEAHIVAEQALVAALR